MYNKTFKMNKGDIVISEGDLSLITGPDELRQTVQNRLSINKNEWFLDTELGLDYMNIVGKHKDYNDIDLAVRDCLYKDNRLESIETRINVNNKARSAVIDVIAMTTEGNIEMKEVLDIE